MSMQISVRVLDRGSDEVTGGEVSRRCWRTPHAVIVSLCMHVYFGNASTNP